MKKKTNFYEFELTWYGKLIFMLAKLDELNPQDKFEFKIIWI